MSEEDNKKLLKRIAELEKENLELRTLPRTELHKCQARIAVLELALKESEDRYIELTESF
jgi:hypothetical protein